MYKSTSQRLDDLVSFKELVVAGLEHHLKGALPRGSKIRLQEPVATTVMDIKLHTHPKMFNKTME